MTLPGLEAVAQLAVGRVVNSLPESLLIVFSAALLLRLIGRRNSGTRFAVWMIAFLAVAALPFLGLGSADSGTLVSAPQIHPALVIPTFWAEAFLFVWIPLSFLALARVVAGLIRVRRIRSGCQEIDLAGLDPVLRHTLEQEAAGRPVCLAVSDQVRVPTAIGFRRPAVVLPPWVLRDLHPEQLRPILIHELAHLARRDDWTNLLQKAVRAVFCFHPALWWIDSRLSKERELACDDAVLVATADPRAYASSLLGLLEKSGLRRGWSMAQAAIGRACEATQRIARILNVGRPATTRISRSALGLAATLSAACCGLLLAAPSLVVFGPTAPADPLQAQAPAPALPHLQPASFHTIHRQSALPMVVSAAFHPDSATAKKLLPAAAPKKHRKAPAQNHLIAHETEQPVNAPAIQLASARPQFEPLPMLLVFETTSRRVPASSPAAAGLARRAATQRQPAPATRVETVEFLEQRDATGVHIQIIHTLVFAPAQPEWISTAI